MMKSKGDPKEKDSDVNESIDVNENKTTTRKDEVKIVGKSLRSLSSCERMRGLSPHCHPLKDRMRD